MGPPRLVKVERVLGEAASVEHAEVRIDAGPFVRRGLAAVIEAGPGEQPGEVGALLDEPPGLARVLAPRGFFFIVRSEDVSFPIGFVRAARGERRMRLGGDNGNLRL